MPNAVTALEDRVLVLKNQVDTLQKDFDPNETRDPKGKWSAGGGSKAITVVEHVRSAGGWINTTRIGQAVNLAAGHLKPKAKDALVTAVSLAVNVGHMGVSDMELNSFKSSLVHLATNMRVSTHQARDHVVGVVQRLRTMNKDSLNKAEQDPVDAHLAKVLAWLKGLDLTGLEQSSRNVAGKEIAGAGAQAPSKAINKLEDRLLVLRDRVDEVVKATS